MDKSLMKINISFSPGHTHYVSAGVLPFLCTSCLTTLPGACFLTVFIFFFGLVHLSFAYLQSPVLSLHTFTCITHPPLFFPFLHCHSFSLVVFTFLLSPSPTLIRRRRYGSALWDWRKEGLIPYLNVCVCVCVCVCVHLREQLCACLHAHPFACVK